MDQVKLGDTTGTGGDEARTILPIYSTAVARSIRATAEGDASPDSFPNPSVSVPKVQSTRLESSTACPQGHVLRGAAQPATQMDGAQHAGNHSVHGQHACIKEEAGFRRLLYGRCMYPLDTWKAPLELVSFGHPWPNRRGLLLDPLVQAVLSTQAFPSRLARPAVTL